MTEHAPAYPAAGPAPERDVPPGPGVVPPFPAPPTEGRSARLWLGLGAGALVAVLFCGGGAAAVIGLIVSSTAAFSERVDASVGGYFRAVQDRRYDDAYRLLCEDAQDAETPAEFASRVGAEDPIRTFRIGELPLSANELMVPVDVVYGDGRAASLDVNLSQDQATGDLEVCGIEE
jgi:hypothetical protein